ncbi:hypothetical protein [Apibacter sp. HY039]|uniref:hypothetical protein n=1 Tax=Apibacter sp. HY039 TaxID=2501476 RepID=UPI000FEC045A|nr:hypothetical protein [Apibacter sp. HY039]
MRKCIVFLFIFVVFTACKTTPEEYYSYPFIDQGIQSEKYEINTIFPSEVELLTLFGHPYPSDPRSSHAEEINRMPLIVYDKSNTLYFRYTDNYKINDYKYNMINNTIDTLNREDMDIIRNSYTNKEDKFVNFKFPYAEKYYMILDEKYHSEISEKEKKEVLEEYKNSSEETKQAIIETRSLRYNTTYSELQMPQEKIHFKFNNYLNKKIEFFGNEELYKKGYIYMYIYSISSQIPHSGGLYVIRPKEKK